MEYKETPIMFLIKNDRNEYFSEAVYAEYNEGWSKVTASMYSSYEEAKQAVDTYHEDCGTSYRFIYEVKLYLV